MEMKANVIRNSRCLPPADETVLKFQYEGSSYPRVWISEMSPEFRPRSAEKAEV